MATHNKVSFIPLFDNEINCEPGFMAARVLVNLEVFRFQGFVEYHGEEG